MPRPPKAPVSDVVQARMAALQAIQRLQAAFSEAINEVRVIHRVATVAHVSLESVRHRLNETLTDMDTRIMEMDAALDALEETQHGHKAR